MKFVRATIRFFIEPYARLFRSCVKRMPALSFMARPVKADPAPFVVALSDFVFHSGCGRIYSALSEHTAPGSLSEEASEDLDLQLVWAKHPDIDKTGDYLAMTIAALKEAWLWQRCSEAMAGRDNFYRDKAVRVAYERMQRVHMLVSMGDTPVAEVVEQFARTFSGSELSIEAWGALCGGHSKHASYAGGFHVFMGHQRRTVLRAGSLTLTQRMPVWFGGQQSESEADSQRHFYGLADRARVLMNTERASQRRQCLAS